MSRRTRPAPSLPSQPPPAVERSTAQEPPAWLVWAAPLAAAAIVHGGALTGFFAADDLDFLARARGLEATPWGWARPLPGVLRWRFFTAWFGVQPLPHLLLAWLLHAATALLVARVAHRAGLGRRVALTAGVLAGATSIAYTSTHWASGLGEVMAAAFAIATLALHIECRARRAPALAWLAGACAVCAVLSKESAVLLPAAVWAFDRMVPVRGEGRGALPQVAGMGTLAGIGVFAAFLGARHVGGEAYALARSPGAWLATLATYGAWLVRVGDPIRDRSAVPDPSLLPWGVGLFLAWALVAWGERAQRMRPVTAGLAWFLLLLAPVLPLAHRAYLYYLVAPFAGVAVAAAALSSRALARVGPRVSGVVLALALAAVVGHEAWQVHVRGTLVQGGFRVDRVARESGLLRNALADLAAARVAQGDTIVLVNPYPLVSVDPSRGIERAAGSGFGAHAYVPLVAALRDGAALRLFLPGVTVLGMGDGVPREWERARVFRFDNEGRLADLGRGAAALDSLATDYVLGERWADARGELERVIALGGDGPEVRWRLGEALGQLGDDAGGLAKVQMIPARWPDSPRAQLVREYAPSASTR